MDHVYQDTQVFITIRHTNYILYISINFYINANVGVSGSANSKCNLFQNVINIGEPCTESTKDQCIYSVCTNDVCGTMKKQCASDDKNVECSGHGQCHRRLVNDPLTEATTCDVTDNNCLALCYCQDGYTGQACSINPDNSRSRAKSTICRALITINNMSDTTK